MEDKNRNQFREVKTGNGVDRDLAATTNDRLELTVIELQNLQRNNSTQTKKLSKLLETLDDSIVYLKSDIGELNETIKEANNKNDKIQTWFFWLSIIGTGFTILSVIQVIDILIRGLGK